MKTKKEGKFPHHGLKQVQMKMSEQDDMGRLNAETQKRQKAMAQ